MPPFDPFDVPDNREYGRDVDAKLDDALVESIELAQESGDGETVAWLRMLLAIHYERAGGG